MWLGNSVVINKGVHIKSGSMIGIGAIVTHDIPANVVAVGIPAKVVRQNISWSENYDKYYNTSLQHGKISPPLS